MIISYAESIMKPTAEIIETIYPKSTSYFLEHVQAKIAAGLYYEQQVYNTDGKAVVNKLARNGLGVAIPDSFEESMLTYSLAYNYANENFNMKQGDSIMLSESNLYVSYPGGGLELHTDDHVLTADGTKQFGINMQRGITLLVYLNTEFEGGDLYFPLQNKRIAPQVGKMVIFPSNKHFRHMVDPILSGSRCAYQRFYGIVNGASGTFIE